jgi:TetR/AcrR family tetracycline transcriptional repressor
VSERASQPRQRGPGRPGLTLAVISSETLSLIDEQGVGAASMRAIASRLGVEAQSLYAHVDSRGKLLDAVVDRIVNELSADPKVSLRPDGHWRPYLADLAHGVRRYARAHPHAFPLVATRPVEAPWLNPPLRSLRWIEAFLASLRAAGFDADRTLFAYRTFNSFLLGFLLLETGAMSLDDPAPGDGSFAGADDADAARPAEAAVPGALSPTRTSGERQAIRRTPAGPARIDPLDRVDTELYPTIQALAEGLAVDYFDVEFESGLQAMLDRIELIETARQATRT